MFKNLVNAQDLYALLRKIRHGELRRVLRRVGTRKQRQVAASWDHVQSKEPHWFDLPAVRERENRLVSGDTAVSHVEYLSQKYLSTGQDLSALSLGCGTGWREIRWARAGKFSRIDAYDLSEPRIRYATEQAALADVGNVLNYHAADIYDLDLPQASYDVVLIEDALHHFSPVEGICAQIRAWLKPNGFLFVNDYVGPSRFQLTDRQLEVANKLLVVLPSSYRSRWSNGQIKTQVVRPSRLRMIMKDPSEAIESNHIMPLLHRFFDVLEVRKLGGTIVYPVLEDIAQNFMRADGSEARFLKLFFELEELLMDVADIESDHVLAVCRQRSP